MSQGKIKLYKNPQRNDTMAHKPYVPQYQVLGVEPEEFKSHQVPDGTQMAKGSQDNPRTKKISMRQPYAEPANTAIGIGRGPMPNVGNNLDHTWSGVDHIIDDLEEIDLQSQMIDNNDYVTDSALGLKSNQFNQASQPSLINQSIDKKIKSKVLQVEEDVSVTLQKLPEQSYLLLVNDVVICSGPASKVEGEARDLVFGDHPLCDGEPIPVENLVIVKKVSIKVGVFIE